jgi:hypothetical protein
MRVVIGLLLAILGAGVQGSTPGEADEILAQLSKIRLDKKQIHSIRDITLRRDVLTIALNRGTIAFLEPVNGKVTGAVFIGSGEIVAIPPDAIERQQVSRFVGTPILNDAFETAVFRFTDATYDEIQKEIAQHAVEDVSPEDAARFDVWDTAIGRRSAALNLRFVADFLEPPGEPFFLAELNGAKSGWFTVLFDTRSTEEVSIFQVREFAATVVTDVWASFNQRSEARVRETVAHENKSPIDVLAYEIDGMAGAGNTIDVKATMQIKARAGGTRLLNFELLPSLRVASASIVSGTDEAVNFYPYSDANGFGIVLPRPLQASQEVVVRVSYAGDVSGAGPWYPSQRQQTIPAFKSTLPAPFDRSMPGLEYMGRRLIAASYHDQWLVEGLSRYLAALSPNPADSDAQVRKLLDDARQGLIPVESAGPIWLGQRLISTIRPDAYRTVYGKGLWVVHMLRAILRQDGQQPDAKFLAMLQEFAETYDGKAASTWDFKRVAEKHAGQKLDWFFDQWVFATGLPIYALDYKISAEGNAFTAEGTITQTGVPDGFVMAVPVYADTTLLGRVEIGDSDGQFRFRLSAKPERLHLDPEMTILTGGAQ